MAIVPRVLVCSAARNSPDNVATFAAIPFVDHLGKRRRGVLMFTSEKTARTFVENDPKRWHLRQLDYSLVRDFLTSPMNTSWFDCVVVDFRNDGKPQIVTVLELDAAIIAIDKWRDESFVMPRAEAWQGQV